MSAAAWRPLAGVTVLDLSTVGPAARCTRLLADYGARVVKVGPGAVGGRCADRAAVLRLQRPPRHAAGAARPEGRRRPGGLPRAGRGGRRGRRELPSRRGRPAGHRLRRRRRRATPASSTARPAATARTARTPSGPATTSTTWPSAATWPCPRPGPTAAPPLPGRDHRRRRRRAACTRRWPSRPRWSAGRTSGRGAYLDVSVADGVLWLMSLSIDEQLARGGDVPSGPRRPHRPLRLLRHLPAADGRWLAVGAIEPKFFANLCAALGCSEWPPHSSTTTRRRHPGGPRRGVRRRGPRDEWVDGAGRGRHLRGARARRGRGGRRPAVRGPAASSGRPSIRPRATLRQLAPLLAGHGPRRAAAVACPTWRPDTDTEHLLKEAGVDGETVARWVARGVVA